MIIPESINYVICHRNKAVGTGAIVQLRVSLPNVRSLAKYLNNFKRQNPHHQIFVAYIEDQNKTFKVNVKFLPDEYRAQKFLTGYKERLLANALERGYPIKWNHGLKPEKEE